MQYGTGLKRIADTLQFEEKHLENAKRSKRREYFQARRFRDTVPPHLILHNATQFRLHSVIAYKTPGYILHVMGAGCCCFIDRQFTEPLFLEGPSFVAERRRREILGLL